MNGNPAVAQGDRGVLRRNRHPLSINKQSVHHFHGGVREIGSPFIFFGGG